MTVGQGSLMGDLSYLAVGREVTFGTYSTCTAGLNILSANFKTLKETKILEQIETSRTNSQSIKLGRTLEGSIEGYYSPQSDGCNYLLQNAFGGGPVTSATATGETAGGLAFQHTIDIANFNVTYSSLCFNHRKGEATIGKIFEYSGFRVNEFSLKAEVDDALMMSIGLIGKDSSTTSNDVSGAMTNTQTPLSFVDGRISIETTNSFTTTSYWNIQSFEIKLSNNLKSDSDSRRIGSDTIDVLPAGLAVFEFTATMRFDTLTAYNAMLAGTRFYAEIQFQGATLTGSAVREGIKLQLPNIQMSDAGDPEVGGPNEVLLSEISFAVLRDPTTSGYAFRAVVTNLKSTYV